MEYVGKRFVKFNIETGKVTASIGLDPELMSKQDYDKWVSLGYTIKEIVMVDQGYWIMGFEPLPSLDKAREKKIYSIRANARKQIDLYEQDYSNLEKESWVKQEKGAKLILANPSIVENPSEDTNVEFIVKLAAKRGLNVTELCQRILSRITHYNDVQSTCLARQRNKEALVALATTIEEIEAIQD